MCTRPEPVMGTSKKRTAERDRKAFRRCLTFLYSTWHIHSIHSSKTGDSSSPWNVICGTICRSRVFYLIKCFVIFMEISTVPAAANVRRETILDIYVRASVPIAVAMQRPRLLRLRVANARAEIIGAAIAMVRQRQQRQQCQRRDAPHQTSKTGTVSAPAPSVRKQSARTILLVKLLILLPYP